MNQRNWVAKHMNSYNRHQVVEDKRNKKLDELYEDELTQYNYEENDWHDEDEYRA